MSDERPTNPSNEPPTPPWEALAALVERSHSAMMTRLGQVEAEVRTEIGEWKNEVVRISKRREQNAVNAVSQVYEGMVRLHEDFGILVLKLEAAGVIRRDDGHPAIPRALPEVSFDLPLDDDARESATGGP